MGLIEDILDQYGADALVSQPGELQGEALSEPEYVSMKLEAPEGQTLDTADYATLTVTASVDTLKEVAIGIVVGLEADIVRVTKEY